MTSSHPANFAGVDKQCMSLITSTLSGDEIDVYVTSHGATPHLCHQPGRAFGTFDIS